MLLKLLKLLCTRCVFVHNILLLFRAKIILADTINGGRLIMKSKRLLAYVLALAIIVSGFSIPTTANANVLDDARALIKSVSNKIETTAKDKDVKKKTLTVKNKKVLNYKVKSSTKLDKLVFDKTTIGNAASISAKCSVVFKNKSKIKKLKAYNDLTLSSNTKSYKIPVESLFLYKSKIKVNSKIKHKLAEIGSKVKSSTLLLQKNVTKVVDRGTKNKITINKCKVSDTYMKGKSSSLYVKSATLKSLSLGNTENKAIVKSSTVGAIATKGTKASVSISSGSSITEYYNTGKQNIVRVQDSYVKDYKVGGSKTTHYIKSCKVPKLRLYGTYNTAHVWYPSNMRYRISSSTNKLYIHGYGITGTTSGIIDGVYSGKGGIITIDSIDEENNVKRSITVYLDESGKVDRVDERTSDGTDNKTDDDIINDTDDKEDNKNNGNHQSWWGGGSSSSSGGSTPSTPVRPQKQAGICSIRAYNVEYRQPLNIVSVSSTNGDSNVSYSFKTQGAADSTYTATTPSGIGSYTVKATYAETDTYESCEATADFDIEKMTNTASIGLPDDLVANGVVTDGAFTFSIDNNENNVPIIIQPVDASVVTGSAVGNNVTINPLKNSNTTVKVIIPEGEFYKATEKEFTVSFRNLAGYYSPTGEFTPWVEVTKLDDPSSPTKGFRITNGALEHIYTTFDGGKLIVDKSVNNMTWPVFSGTTLEELVLPGSIKNIICQGNSTCLRKLTLKEGVESLDSVAFQNYTALSEVNLPSSLKYIKNSAFANDNALTTINLNEGLLEIGSNAFGGCSNLEDLNIPSSVTTLGENPFKSTKIQSLDLTGNLTNCSNCVTLDMPELNTVLIGKTLIDHVRINNGHPDMMSVLGWNNCANVNVSLTGDINVVPEGAFNNVQFKTLTLQEGITGIEANAFEFNRALQSVNFPDTLETIGSSAFFQDFALTSFNVPINVTDIAGNCLSMTGVTSITVATGNAVYDSRNNCNAVMETDTDTLVIGTANSVIPEDTKHIGAYAFSNQSLSNIDLSNNYELESIGTCAFSGTGASTAYIPETVKSISTGAFYIPGLKVSVPSQCRIIEDNAFQSVDVVVYNGDADDISGCGATTIANGGYLTDDGDFIDWSTLGIDVTVDCVRGRNVSPSAIKINNLVGKSGTLSIPKGISYIGASNLSGNSVMNRALLPSTISVISKGAFNSSQITHFYLPDSVIELGGDVFCMSKIEWCKYGTAITNTGYGTFVLCSNLKTVIIPDNITQIDQSTFLDCSSLTCINIPNTVRSISNNSFADSGLVNITIPRSVTNIDTYAFRMCNDLEEVYIYGEGCTIGNAAFYQCKKVNTILIQATEINSIGASCFMDCGDNASDLKVTIDAKVNNIGSSAFNSIGHVTQINLLGEIGTIDASAFANSSSISDLDILIQESVQCINNAAFYQCSAAGDLNITINSDVIDTGTNCFCYMIGNNITVNISGSIHNFGQAIFCQTTAADTLTLNISGNMNILGKDMFVNSSGKDVNINITANITDVKDHALHISSTNPVNLNLPDSIQRIGVASFCELKIDELILPDNLQTIGSGAFVVFSPGASNNIVIPDSVTTIGSDAFLNVSHITYNGSATGAPWGALSMN